MKHRYHFVADATISVHLNNHQLDDYEKDTTASHAPSRALMIIDADETPVTFQCEASEDGVDCESEATHTYTVNATAWGGFPSEERHLCDEHGRKVARLWLLLQGVEKLDEELEQEPYYSRADEEADIANAAYWDEVARGGSAA